MSCHRWEALGWLLGSLGFASACVGSMLAPSAFAYAWLIMLVLWVGWPLGCMGLLLIHALTGGDWGYVIRSPLCAGLRAIALLPPLLIPYAIVAPLIYPWLGGGRSAPLANAFYLNAPAFMLRGALYLLLWCGLAAIIVRRLRARTPSRISRSWRQSG